MQYTVLIQYNTIHYLYTVYATNTIQYLYSVIATIADNKASLVVKNKSSGRVEAARLLPTLPNTSQHLEGGGHNKDV